MWRVAGTTGAVGIEVAASIAVGYLGGEYLDSRFDTTPWITYFGLAAGTGAAIKALMRVTRRYKKDLEKADKDQNKTPASTPPSSP